MRYSCFLDVDALLDKTLFFSLHIFIPIKSAKVYVKFSVSNFQLCNHFNRKPQVKPDEKLPHNLVLVLFQRITTIRTTFKKLNSFSCFNVLILELLFKRFT